MVDRHDCRQPVSLVVAEAAVRRRCRRVIVLIGAIIILSLADFLVTMTHLKSTGMVEANPIAVYLIRTTESPWVLASFKALTVLICVSLLFKLRRHVEGEIAAWCAVLVLAGMALMWHSYSRSLTELEGIRMVEAAAGDENWLQFD